MDAQVSTQHEFSLAFAPAHAEKNREAARSRAWGDSRATCGSTCLGEAALAYRATASRQEALTQCLARALTPPPTTCAPLDLYYQHAPHGLPLATPTAALARVFSITGATPRVSATGDGDCQLVWLALEPARGACAGIGIDYLSSERARDIFCDLTPAEERVLVSSPALTPSDARKDSATGTAAAGANAAASAGAAGTTVPRGAWIHTAQEACYKALSEALWHTGHHVLPTTLDFTQLMIENGRSHEQFYARIAPELLRLLPREVRTQLERYTLWGTWEHFSYGSSSGVLSRAWALEG